jgi:hypothetical protein
MIEPLLEYLAHSRYSWPTIALGAVLGILITAALVCWFGRQFVQSAQLYDRGPWDKPLPKPFPKDRVIARYVRRRWYSHRHHRHHYRQR